MKTFDLIVGLMLGLAGIWVFSVAIQAIEDASFWNWFVMLFVTALIWSVMAILGSLKE